MRDLLAIRDERRHVRRDVDVQRQAFLRDQRLVERRNLRDDRRDVKLARRHGELVRRTARVGENLAHRLEQLAAAADDARHAVALLLGQRAENPIAQDLGVRDDRRQRRPQVMRDVREKLRLERVARLQLGVDLRRLVQRLLELR